MASWGQLYRNNIVTHNNELSAQFRRENFFSTHPLKHFSCWSVKMALIYFYYCTAIFNRSLLRAENLPPNSFPVSTEPLSNIRQHQWINSVLGYLKLCSRVKSRFLASLLAPPSSLSSLQKVPAVFH